LSAFTIVKKNNGPLNLTFLGNVKINDPSLLETNVSRYLWMTLITNKQQDRYGGNLRTDQQPGWVQSMLTTWTRLLGVSRRISLDKSE
jgi:hypothetical protein